MGSIKKATYKEDKHSSIGEYQQTKNDFFSEKRKTSRVKKGEYTQTNKKQSKKGECTHNTK